VGSKPQYTDSRSAPASSASASLVTSCTRPRSLRVATMLGRPSAAARSGGRVCRSPYACLRAFATGVVVAQAQPQVMARPAQACAHRETERACKHSDHPPIPEAAVAGDAEAATSAATAARCMRLLLLRVRTRAKAMPCPAGAAAAWCACGGAAAWSCCRVCIDPLPWMPASQCQAELWTAAGGAVDLAAVRGSQPSRPPPSATAWVPSGAKLRVAGCGTAPMADR